MTFIMTPTHPWTEKKFPCSGSQLATGSSDPKFLNFQPEGERIYVSWLKWCRGFSFSVCTLYTKVPIQLCQSHGKLKERAPEWLKQMFHNLEERPPSNQTMFAKSVPFCKLKLKSDLCNFCHLSHYQNHHSDPGPKWMVVGHVDVDVDDLSLTNNIDICFFELVVIFPNPDNREM